MKSMTLALFATAMLNGVFAAGVVAQSSLVVTHLDGTQSHKLKSRVRAMVKNNGTRAILLSATTFRRIQGNTWFEIPVVTLGPISVSPGATEVVVGEYNRTSEPITIEFKVDGVEVNTGARHSAAKRIAVAGVKVDWIVRYGTNGRWVPAGSFKGDFGDANVRVRANNHAKAMRERFGFSTKIHTKTNTGFAGIGDFRRDTVQIRSIKEIEKSFPTELAAESFVNALRKHVPNKADVTTVIVDRVIPVRATNATLGAFSRAAKVNQGVRPRSG